MWGAILGGVAAGAVSGLFGSKGAKDAANIQARAAEEATAEQRRQYDISRTDSAPWRDSGSDAISRMRLLLGLGGGPQSVDQLASGLRTSGRYNVPGQSIEQGTRFSTEAEGGPIVGYRFADGTTSDSPTRVVGSNSIDEAGLLAEAKRLFAEQGAGNPEFGALNRRFTLSDFEADPVNKLGLQFGLDEGSKSIRRMFGAQGMGRSGAAAKALTRFGTDYGNTKAGESRSRFMQDQDVTFNRLAGVSGVGQTATAQSANLGANMASNIGQNMMGAANARGASAIAGANAFAAPIAAAGNTLNTKYLLDSMRPQTPPINPNYTWQDNYSGGNW